MSSEPTLWSSLTEHWHIARELRGLQIVFDSDKCTGVWQCYEVCPLGCWKPDPAHQVVIYHNSERCVACGACVLQCPQGAIELI